MTEQVVPSDQVEKIRYFTARVSGAVDPGAPGRQQVLFKALATVPEVQIHLGTFLAKSTWRPVTLLPLALQTCRRLSSLTRLSRRMGPSSPSPPVGEPAAWRHPRAAPAHRI